MKYDNFFIIIMTILMFICGVNSGYTGEYTAAVLCINNIMLLYIIYLKSGTISSLEQTLNLYNF